MNPGNSTISDTHRLLHNLSDKINLKISDKYIPLSNCTICYTWKNKKSHIRTITLKYQLQPGIKNLNYVLDHILYSDIQYYFEYIIKKHEKVANNPPIRIDVNKIENRITFKTKTGYYFEL